MRSPKEFKCVLAHIAPRWPTPLAFPARAQRTLQASRNGEEDWGIGSLDLKAPSFEDIPAHTTFAIPALTLTINNSSQQLR